MTRFINTLRKIDDFFGWLSKAITAAAIAIQTIIMFLGVIFRYFLKSPLTWSDETATLLMVFITFFGCHVALKEKMLARIEFVVESFPALLRTIVIFLSNLLVLTLLAAIAYFGLVLGLSPVILNQNTPALELPMIWFYGIIPLTALFMIVHVLIKTYESLRRGAESQC
ncbi:MAG: TRAP transporter small permease [Thermodesulfobacteriota bacterium]